MNDHLDPVVAVRGLIKRFGPVTAVGGVDFDVRAGEIFAYLGPNGAGKTTTINILCGLLRRDAGEVTVCGIDIDRDPVAVKQQIGVVPEESNLYPELTCRRNLEYLAELYGLPRSRRRTRAQELLENFGLADRSDAPFGTLSRGLKRRLTVAAGIIHSPKLVFLDEPTAGLDVPSARALRTFIREINGEGTTVFLTTHNLTEAQQLSDRVVILIKGRIVAEGTSDDIRRRAEKAKVVHVVFSDHVAAARLKDACSAVQSAQLTEGTCRIEVTDLHVAISQIVSFAGREGAEITQISTSPANLEDAFITILEDDSGLTETGK